MIRKVVKMLFSTFSFRLYLLYFLMVGGSAWFIATLSLKALELSVNQAAEEILIDTANLLAEIAGQEVVDGKINTSQFAKVVPNYLARQLDAKIYQHHKSNVDLNLYLTDRSGIVIYDSTHQSVGKNFSNWRDVRKTLAGQYGARASAIKHHENRNSSDRGLFVSAPIYHNKKIIGALTVIKANRQIDQYILLSNRQIIIYALLIFAISLVAGSFITWWLWRSIRKLSRYAKQLGSGEKTQQPKIIHKEFKPLADAMQNMYEELAGKEYIENYIHTMAHELKSPLTGILASTELLQQDLPPAVRANFTQNIHDSAFRMSSLIERLLHLASLEKRHKLEQIKTINFEKQINILLKDRQAQLDRKNLSVTTSIDKATPLRGEPTLIMQSLANLLDNAIDFSPMDGDIHITLSYHQSKQFPIIISLQDSGKGIDDFAKERLFERFYSTPRPDTQQRSSGLGLAFVKEAISLHKGIVKIQNHPNGGAIATIELPETEFFANTNNS